MSRNVKFIINIVIIVVVIGLLGAGIYFLTRPEEPQYQSEYYTDDNRIKIFSYEPSELIGAEVTNQYGSYSLSRTGGVWTMAGFEDVTLNAGTLDTLVNTFSDLKSDERIAENPEDLTVFGLDQPSATLTLITTGGSKTFYIGNETPDHSGSYFNTDTSNDVYIMAGYIASIINLTAKNYVTIAEGIADTDITGVRIEGGGSVLSVAMQTAGPRDQYGLLSYWDIVEPKRQTASNGDVSNNLVTPISQLEDGVSGVYELTDETLAMYGLDKPEYTVTVTTVKGTVTYDISAPSDLYRYLRRGDVSYIMRVDADACSFVYTQPYNVAEKILALIDISLMQDLVIRYGGNTYELTIVDGGGNNEAFYYGNMQVDADTYRKVYQSVVAIPVSGEIEGEPSADDLVGSIEYILNSGDSLMLEFAPYNDRNYAVFVNGEGLYTVSKKSIDDVFAEVTKIFK